MVNRTKMEGGGAGDQNDLPRHPVAHVGDQKGKPVSKSGVEGQIRTGTPRKGQWFLRPSRLPFRHFGALVPL